MLNTAYFCFCNPSGEKLSPEELRIMVEEADLDGDNEISFIGWFLFMFFWKKIKTLIVIVVEFKRVS